MDDILMRARQKELELMGGVKKQEMGELRQSEFQSSLGQTGVESPDMPQYKSLDDQEQAEHLRDIQRERLKKATNPMDYQFAEDFGFKGNYPTQENIDERNRIAGMGSSVGSIEKMGL